MLGGGCRGQRPIVEAPWPGGRAVNADCERLKAERLESALPAICPRRVIAYRTSRSSSWRSDPPLGALQRPRCCREKLLQRHFQRLGQQLHLTIPSFRLHRRRGTRRFLLDHPAEAEEALIQVQQILQELGLKLSAEKTKITTYGKG